MNITGSADLQKLESLIDELSGGGTAGKIAAQAAMQAINVHIRKDTGEMARDARATSWQVTYPAAYAEYVWDTPPQIVSPQNPLAEPNPHTNPIVAQRIAEQLQLYVDRF